MNNKYMKLSFFYKKSLILSSLMLVPYFVNASPIFTRDENTGSLLFEPYYPTLELEQPLYIDFDKMEPADTLELFKEKYLTLYSTKNEKLKATYLHGAYAINYIQRW